MTQITQQAEVVALGDGWLHLRACQASGCGSCHLSGACGQGVLARLFKKSAPQLLVVPCEDAYQIGDRLELGMELASFNRAVLLQFALPLLLLLVGALLAELLGFTKVWWQLLFAGLGLASGLYWARRLAQPAQLKIIRKLESGDSP